MIKVHLLILSFLCSCVSFALWSQESTKGNWTPSDRKDALEELSKQREIFETFLDSSQIDPMLDCIVNELEANFDNPDSVKTENEFTSKISLKCLEEVGFSVEAESSSTKGNWSEEDLATAYQSLEYTRNVMSDVVDSTKIDQLFDCVVHKLEARYNNMDEAANDTNEGVSALTMECLQEEQILNDAPNDSQDMIHENTGDPNSSVGNWSDADKALLEEQLTELRPQFEKSMGVEGTDIVFECVRFNFEYAFENYASINNHPEIYKAILNECSEKPKQK